MLRAALFLSFCNLQQFEGVDGTMAILSELKSLRDGSVALCEGMAKGLEDEGHADDSKTAKAWCNDWLSILGVNKGLTGLAKDFVLNYLGRDAYHNQNGPLIDSIKKAGSAFPKSGSPSSSEVAAVRRQILAIATEGKKVFKSGGSIFEMLDSLKTMLSKDRIAKHFD